MDRRDSPDVEPPNFEGRTTPPIRRFARLVESPASRKVALPRLLAAALVASGLLALTWIGVTMLLDSAARWVERRPEHQLRFDRIELDPPPDPAIKGGAAQILEQVRAGAGWGETISLLDLDLKGLERDFRRSPWVKDVVEVDRSHRRSSGEGRLVVRLVYRKPVAILEYGKDNYPYVLDEEAVVLNDKDIEWASWRDPYRPLGMAWPLIKIKRVPEGLVAPRAGLPIKRKAEGDGLDFPDPLVLGAARLARFLEDRQGAIPPGGPAIEFVSIYLPEHADPEYFLVDSAENLVDWGRAPGDDRPGKPSSEARWAMLADWLRRHGPLVAKYPDFLHFETSGARMRRPPDRRPE